MNKPLINTITEPSTLYEQLLGKASLFENDFSVDWLQELERIKTTQVLTILNQGIQKGDLEETGLGVYRFKNKKRRQQLLAGFTREEKEEMNQMAVGILIRELPDEEEKASQLASHLLNMPLETFEDCRWLCKAGDQFSLISKDDEAIKCYVHAINALSFMNSDESNQLFIETVYKYCNFHSDRRDPVWILSTIKKALAKAMGMKNKTTQILLHFQLSIHYWLQSNYSLSQRHFQQGQRMAKEIEAPDTLKIVQRLSTFFYNWQGKFKNIIEAYEQTEGEIDHYPKGSFNFMVSLVTAHAFVVTGKVTQGVGMLQALYGQAQNGQLHKMSELTETYLCDVLVSMRRIDDAYNLLANHTEESIRNCHIFFRKDLAFMQALVCYLKGETKKSVKVLKLGLELVEQSHREKLPFSTYGYAMRISWDMEIGKYPKVEGLSLEKEIQRALNSQNLLFQGTAYRYQAKLLVRQGASSAEVLKQLDHSLRLLLQSGHQLAIAYTHVEYSRIHLASGNKRKAINSARKATDIFPNFNGVALPDDLSFLARNFTPESDLLERIIQMGQEMSAIRDNSDIVRSIIIAVIRITGAERAALFLVKKGVIPVEFKLKAAKNLTEDEISQPLFQESMKIINEVAETGKKIVRKIKIANTSNLHSVSSTLSCLCMPMLFKNELMGVLYLDNRFFSINPSHENLRILSFFASQAAVTIDNADAYDEVRRLNKKLNEEKRYYQEQNLEILHSDGIIGRSPAILEVMKKVNHVAKTDTTVLIIGETGVGKELVAGALLNASARADKPFIRVNCSVFSDSLIASELFGYEKGAFTGANETRPGRFELADHGTLFLDEIGDVPLEVQVRLLRVLQSREFERVGGTRTLFSDFRLVAATHQNLAQLVSDNTFREDLFYRLNIFPIQVPPLRERREDIPQLTIYFLEKFCKKLGKPVLKIRQSEMNTLCDYNWPGNVRELEHIIERGTIMSSGPVMRLPELQHFQYSSENQDVSTIRSLEDNERDHILRTLEMTRWKVSGPNGAAKILGVNPNTLTSKMSKLRIHRNSI